MDSTEKVINIQKTIAAPAAKIYQAFTNASKLRQWLCNFSSALPVEDGRIYLAWDSGYYTAGHFITLIPNEKIILSWNGKGEPHSSLVTIEIQSKDNYSLLTLSHSDILVGEEWGEHIDEIEKGWVIGLENLVSVLETGIDLRISQRPLIGIFPENFDESKLEKTAPVKKGIRIMDVVPGFAAEKGGLERGDIIIDIEGMPITDWLSLTDAISQFKAGDQISITFYREFEKKTCFITLSQQALPDLPESPQQLAETLRTNQNDMCDKLMAYLRNISEEEASFSPNPDEWSIKEIITHLIHTERDLQSWINDLIQNNAPQREADIENIPARIQATVSLYPSLLQLLELLRTTLKETVAFF